MARKTPLIISIVGKSDSGKTTLILKLLPALKEKGYKVAVAKHCPCGFDLDVEGKDSWRFTQAGAQGIFLSSEDSLALMVTKPDSERIKKRLQNSFSDFDLVLMEGYQDESGIKKIQIIRKEIAGEIIDTEEIAAYICNMDLNTDKPVYSLDDITGIVSFIRTQKVK